MAQEKILIVEDEQLIVLDLKNRLERLGYIVCASAKNSKEALLAVNDYMPDLILMDIKIEGEPDGIETAKQIQEIAPCPIVYLTAYADHATLSRAKETVPYGYLTKPIQEKDLLTTIEIALNKSKIEKELRRTKEELALSEHKNKTLIDALPDLIFRVKKDGILLLPE